jgi:CcdB protein
MPQFLDVVEPTLRQRRQGLVGFIVFQSDYATMLDTILVVPCVEMDANLGLGKLTPKIEIGGQVAIAMVPRLAGIRRSELGSIVLASAQPHRDDLLAALDRLVTGF